MRYQRVVYALLVFALLLLPGPAYAAVLDDVDGPDRHRTSRVLGATELNVSTETGERELVERYGSRVTLRFAYLPADYNRDEYRAPNRTRAVLSRAVEHARALETGSATTTDPAVASDLATIADRYAFVTDYANDRPRADLIRYAVSVTTDGDETTVSTSRVNQSAVAEAVLDRYVVQYESLPPAERETVDEILAESDGEYDGYRPYSDEPVPETPLIVEKEGTYYDVRTVAHVDDFGPSGGLLVGLLASALGVVALLSAGVVALVGYVRSDGAA